MDKATKYASMLTKIHFGIVGLFIVVAIISAIFPGPVTEAVVSLFLVYIYLSVFPPIIIIVLSIIGLIRSKEKASNVLCLIFSLIYDFVLFSVVMYMGSHF
jgi:hypothetical protein